MKFQSKYKKKYSLKFILLISFCAVFYCCGKNRDISGYVYSSNHILVPNVEIIMQGYDKKGGKRYEYLKLRTDDHGKFAKTQSMNKKVNYFEAVATPGDSGTWSGWDLSLNDIKHLDVYLHK